MVGALAFVLLNAQIPDARDAYEAAGKLLRDPGVTAATRIRYHQLDNLPVTLPKGLSLTTTPLEAVRWQSKALAQVLEIVQKGNDLPYAPEGTRPNDVSAFSFPELAVQKEIAKAMTDFAWLKISEGKSDEAVQALLATEAMSFRTADFSLIHYLVNVAVEAIIQAFVNDFLSVFTAKDWDQLIAMSARRLSDVDLLGRVFEGDLKGSEENFLLMRKDLPNAALFRDDSGDSKKKLDDPITAAYFKALTPARWGVILDRFMQERRNQVQELKGRLREPEANWNFALVDPNAKEPKVIRSDSDVVQALTLTLASAAPDAVIFKSRVQFRLLLLHGRVRKYFWNHRKYPDSLKDVATAAENFDPLSRKPFVYEKLETGYKLASSGRPGLIGEVALKYRSPPNVQNDGADGPP